MIDCFDINSDCVSVCQSVFSYLLITPMVILILLPVKLVVWKFGVDLLGANFGGVWSSKNNI